MQVKVQAAIQEDLAVLSLSFDGWLLACSFEGASGALCMEDIL